MATIEASGIAEVGKETELSGGLFVTLEETRTPRKFYVRVSGERKQSGKVRHRRHIRKSLTDDSRSG